MGSGYLTWQTRGESDDKVRGWGRWTPGGLDSDAYRTASARQDVPSGYDSDAVSSDAGDPSQLGADSGPPPRVAMDLLVQLQQMDHVIRLSSLS